MHRLQTRIILYYVLFILLLIVISGYLLQWNIRRSMESELGAKLTSVASAGLVMFDTEELEFLLSMEGTRLRERFKNKLHTFQKATQTKRTFLFNREGHIIADTEEDTYDLGLTFFTTELETVFSGENIHSILFTGIDGKPSMTGFAPIKIKGDVVAGIGVEGSVPYLESLRQLQTNLLRLLIGSLITAISIGIILARTITQPVRRLSLHSRKIADGDYATSITLKGKDEINHLASIMEEMRKNILYREEELKAMVAGVAHEIRNPLGGMELFSDLLKDEIKDNQQASEHLDRIRRELNHLKSTVNRFLDFARPQHPDMENTNLKSIIDEVVELLKGNKINIQNNVPETTQIVADPNHIREILLNVLQNAVDILPEEKGRIGCSLSKSTKTETILLIGDNGPGIPDNIQREIFNPFFTTRTQGTGLGLSIARALARANHGDLILKKSDKDGTIFSIVFSNIN